MKTHEDRKVVHVIATCRDCGASFEDYKTAYDEALEHAQNTGHSVSGEIAYSFMFETR